MNVNELHKFLLSFKLDGRVQTTVVEAINLRHAKEKVIFGHENVSDIRDWTDEKSDELESYISRQLKTSGVEVRNHVAGNNG